MKKTVLAGLAGLCVWLYATKRHYAIFLQILALILAAILAIIPLIMTYWAASAQVNTLIAFIPLIGTFLIFLLTAVLVILCTMKEQEDDDEGEGDSDGDDDDNGDDYEENDDDDSDGSRRRRPGIRKRKK